MCLCDIAVIGYLGWGQAGVRSEGGEGKSWMDALDRRRHAASGESRRVTHSVEVLTYLPPKKKKRSKEKNPFTLSDRIFPNPHLDKTNLFHIFRQ